MKAVRRHRLASLGASLYDAAKPVDGQRSSFLAFPLTAEKEFTQYTRRNLLRKKRGLEANLSAVGAIIEKVGRYSVGKGRLPIPQTTDMAWNEARAKEFVEWASNANVCDAAGMMNFWQMQTWVAESRFGEGEAFIGKVNSSNVGAPQLQLFDNGEVEYLAGVGAGFVPPGEFTYWDGVKLNSKNRIVAYSIRTLDGGGYQDVKAYDMIHVCKRKRPNQFRAITPFHAGANSAIDALDLKALETASAKLHSALGVVVTKKDGGGVGAGGLTGNLKQLLAPGVGDGKQGAIGEDFLTGAAIAHLAVGEDIKLVSSARPSMNTLEFLAWFYRDVSISTGVPVEIWWDMSQLGGGPARITLADAQWFFDLIGEDVDDQFNDHVWIWWLASRLANGEIPFPNDPDWWAVTWQGPAKLTADSGNAANAQIQSLGNGLETWASIYASRGKLWRPQIVQRVAEIKFAMDEAKRQGVPFDLVLQPKPGAAALGGFPQPGAQPDPAPAP